MFEFIRQYNLQRRRKRRGPYVGDHGYPIDLTDECVKTINRVKSYTMTPPERVAGLCEAVRYITTAGIEGAIVECGVWKGGSMMAVAESLSRFGDQNRELYLFDTYTGMTAPSEHDVSVRGDNATERLQAMLEEDPNSQWCGASLEEVRNNMLSTGYPAEKTHLVPGMVEETIPGQAPEKIALLRLDTDWYESTRHEMEHLFPRISEGGVLIIDDYGHWRGSQQAVDEYLESNGIAILLNRLDYAARIGIRHSAIHRSGQSVASPQKPTSFAA